MRACLLGGHLTFLDATTVQEIMMHDLTALCRLFEGLLSRVEEGVVFCMIDGMSWYETESRSGTMQVVMPFLQSPVDAIAASNSRFIFKLLMTSPVMSHYARDWFRGEVILDMQSDNFGEEKSFGEFNVLEQSQEILYT